MLQLSPLTESDFPTLISWIDSPEGLFQFAGEQFDYPLTEEQLVSYLKLKKQKPFKAIDTDTGKMVAQGEFNFSDSKIPRLSRILVNPNERGKGIGEQLVRLMAKRLFEDESLQIIDLRVFEWNKGAVRCYEKVGFKIILEKTTEFPIMDTVWTRLYMELKRENLKL